MWPILTEMTRDECRKYLRYLELDAYANMVSVLRAQGPFTSEKQKLLQELAKVLHISNERQRAEIRRAVNDDKLTMIAKQLNGPNTGIDWTIEGRRLIPLLPRLKARSTYTMLANSLSLATAVANEKKPEKQIISDQSENSLKVAEIESQLETKISENLSVDPKSCKLENDVDSNKILQTANLAENEKTHNKYVDEINKVDKVDKAIEKPKISTPVKKRKCLSPLLTTPSNKVLIISKPLSTIENEQTTEIPSQATVHHQNITIDVDDMSDSKKDTIELGHSSECITVPVNKHVVTTSISVSTGNAKTIIPSMQNKVSTKLVPVISSNVLNTSFNKTQLENKDVQIFDDTKKIQKPENVNSNLLGKKKSVASFIHENIVPVKSSNTHRLAHTVAVYPGTTVSSGPGPPQIKQIPTTLTCKKLPSEQTSTINHQSKPSVTINSKNVVNMSHYPNTKLNTKANVIVIQKGHTKGVTLSHAGKEVLGKVIMGGKNLCVTSQHNASSVNVQKHHIPLNNGDQTTTEASLANSSQGVETIKTNSGKTTVVSVVTTHLRHDVLDKSKAFSQLFDSPVLNSESKIVIPNPNAHLPKEECSSETDSTNGESSQKTDSTITFMTEEKQCRKNNDNMDIVNSQVINSLELSKSPRNKKILVKSTQFNIQDAEDNNLKDPDKDVDTFDATLDSTDMNLENFQYLADNEKNRDSKESIRSLVIVKQVDEHDDS